MPLLAPRRRAAPRRGSRLPRRAANAVVVLALVCLAVHRAVALARLQRQAERDTPLRVAAAYAAVVETERPKVAPTAADFADIDDAVDDGDDAGAGADEAAARGDAPDAEEEPEARGGEGAGDAEVEDSDAEHVAGGSRQAGREEDAEAEGEEEPDADDGASGKDAAAAGARKHAKWGSTPPRAAALAASLAERGAGADELLNGTAAADALLAALLDGLDVPRNGVWAGPKVQSMLVHARSAAPAFGDAAGKELVNRGCLPERDYAKHHRTCAVVGNGGVMGRDARLGRGIDAHDVVFRFNDGPTAGFEKFVGRKTTFRLINNNWSRFVKEHSASSPPFEQGSLLCFGHGARRSFGELCRDPSLSGRLFFMDPKLSLTARALYRHVAHRMSSAGAVHLSGRNAPPTGVEGLMFAAAICDRISAYGFHVDLPPSLKVPYHYHNRVRAADTAHQFDFAGKFLKALRVLAPFTLCNPADVKDTPAQCLNPKGI